LQQECVITRMVRAAPGVLAPGHIGELTQVIDFALVDAVLEETGTRERRRRLLPSRVVVYFVLALALFEHCSYRAVWGKLTCGLGGLAAGRPAASSLGRARRRVGARPLRALFETLAGPVGAPGRPGVFYRGLRTVAVDGTYLHVPDDPAITWRYRGRAGERLEFGYPLLRLLALVECGTRAVLAAAFGPDTAGELAYAGRLLGALDAGMLVLADAYFDAAGFLRDVSATGAQFLVRSSARRCPTPLTRLPDGSYLARVGYGVLPGLLTVRVIEAAVTTTLDDGTTTTEHWRLLTSLLDHARCPAAELVALYHERWQAETTYYSIKETILDGRVLRSRTPPGIDQEIWALLTLYQALIRAAADTAATRPGLDMDRISFIILLQTAGNLVISAAGILPDPHSPPDLAGEIGRAALDDLLPAWRRQRTKARTRKHRTSKYGSTPAKHPRTARAYTFHARVTFFTKGLAPRAQR
jgi:Insertion element 4 transposase N-terminal/Transposase DDE domain